MLNNNRLLDGIVLTRNAFELMIILFGIRIDTIVRKEYCREDSYERYLERKKVDVILLYLNVIMVLPILFLKILYEEKIIDNENFQDIVIFKYIIEKITLIYFCNNIDKNKLKAANRYAFLLSSSI